MLVVIAGCGSKEQSTATEHVMLQATTAAALTSTEDSSAELEAAVRAYSDAFLSGNSAAYEQLSQRCKDRMPRAGFLQVIAAAKDMYGPQEIVSLKVDQIAGDLGRVTTTYAKSELNQRSEPWVRENGAWRVDDC
ncbi:hypothetical protein GCM10027200_33330 [Lentzea nigeriaca]